MGWANNHVYGVHLIWNQVWEYTARPNETLEHTTTGIVNQCHGSQSGQLVSGGPCSKILFTAIRAGNFKTLAGFPFGRP